MSTGIAQLQPRSHQCSPLPQRYPSSGYPYEFGLDSPFLDAPHHGSTDAPPETELGNRLRRPYQYAYPLQSPSSIPDRTPLLQSPASRIDVSEHMLRRKTPSGTLAAGYDGTPVEWTKRPHAIKHILIPTSGMEGPQPDHFGSGAVLDSYTAYSKPAALANINEHRAWAWNNTASQSESMGFISPTGRGRSSVQWSHKVPQPSGLDSMLNQTPLPQQNYYSMGFQHVPAVLQPVWPPNVGPTASSEQGPYGPYWPNGSFIPYRPAAVRDMRFPQLMEGQHMKGVFDDQANICKPHDRSSGSRPSLQNTRHYTDEDDQWSTKKSGSHITDDIGHPQSLCAMQGQRHSLHQIRSGTEQIRLGPSVYQVKPSSEVRRDVSRKDGLWSPVPSPSLSSTFQSERGVPETNLQFKEKTLAWAHRIYINLLASLHQSRKHGLSKQQSADRQIPNVCIYPRPPGKPFPASRPTGGTSQKAYQGTGEVHRGGVDSTLLHQRFAACVVQAPDGHAEDSEKSPWPRSEYSFLDGGKMISENWHPGEQRTKSSHSVHSHRRLVEYAGGQHALMSPTFIPNPHANTPTSDAIGALEVLTRLCQENDWQWTDGLLLGGCLAYGLADYDKALGWYSRVLECDPNNVEAISNMAATFLSLNQRNEAEQYWLRSVKLRPSYFEAVEHLIGLFCGDQRSKEAVKILDFVESSLRIPCTRASSTRLDHSSIIRSESKWSTSTPPAGAARPEYGQQWSHDQIPSSTGFGSSGYAIPESDNGRMLALIHAKGNMLYALGDNVGAAKAFEDAILIGAGRRDCGIGGLIKQILQVFSDQIHATDPDTADDIPYSQSILLLPELALQTAQLCFPTTGQLPGLRNVPDGSAKRAAISTTSNSLLSLAKIYQDGMSSSAATADGPKASSGVQDILALYYLSLSLQPSPSTANNVGILLASVQQSAPYRCHGAQSSLPTLTIPGVVPGSGIALALAYYNYGLNLDSKHAHLYTNLGSLLKDIGQLSAAIKMYEQAVACDGTFDIALANLANAVKDQGRISDAIGYYKRAVSSNAEFAEAVCGLANALNSVCSWRGRGGINFEGAKQDRWHVNEQGMLLDARVPQVVNSGWIGRVVAIVERQLDDGQSWGREVIRSISLERLVTQCGLDSSRKSQEEDRRKNMVIKALEDWAGGSWEGAKVVRFVERATKRLGWQMYQDMYVQPAGTARRDYTRPQLPPALAIPSAPTVLPFHTFTCPLTAKQIRKISQRNGLRISCSTLRAPWLPARIFTPPPPPNPYLRVGYVSSDFNNHPLAHLMQSVFGFHNIDRVKAYCYATTASDSSLHREQIQKEAPVFYDASSWAVDRLVKQIIDDGIHILINLNGYTRGARNEVFAARPAPIQMSFMGFAGTLGAEWCDYLLADTTAIPPQTLRPWRRNVDLVDQTVDDNYSDELDRWVYGENIIYTRNTFFCCDHRQSAPDSQDVQLTWPLEQKRRWKMRKELFPDLSDDAVILGNFNQLYKIEPTTFRTWLRILSRVPKAVLWLLRFPDLGESNLRETAMLWAGAEVASQLVFTDVAPKHQHISRARVCDLFLDTPECNAHTTAADVLWSGTPLLTFPRYEYKMCSRMAASILKGALPANAQGERAAEDLIVRSDEEYEERAVRLGNDLAYSLHQGSPGCGEGRLTELRKLLYESRWTSALFDTRRWVRDLEEAYEEAWRRWVAGEGGDIWM